MPDENPFAVIARDMRALPEETRKPVRRRLRTAAEVLATETRREVSWSSTIPSTVRVRTSFRVNREGVDVLMGNRSTPHARPYEHLGQGGTFRVRVFGQDVWVDRAARPALFPSAIATQGQMTAEVIQVLDDAAAALGFS